MAAAIVLGLATPAWSAGEPKLSPEARLIEVYKLIGAGNTRAALQKAEALTQDVPTFQLAQLVYGDLLMARSEAIKRRATITVAAPDSSPNGASRSRDEPSQDDTEESAGATSRRVPGTAC